MTAIHWLNPVSGAFTNAADWSGGVVPGENDDAILDATGASFTVTFSLDDRGVDSIQLAANATLDITDATFGVTSGTGAGANAGRISIGGGAFAAAFDVEGRLDNTGEITLDSTGQAASLVIGGATTLTGGGSIILGSGGPNQILAQSSQTRFTLDNIDNTFSGAGVIGPEPGQGAGLKLTNEAAGVIDADVGGGALVLGGTGFFVNHGLIEATGGGQLEIETLVEGGNGTIFAGSGSSVTIHNAICYNQEFITNAAGNITLSGQTYVRWAGSIANSGTIVDDSVGTILPGLLLQSNTSLRGGGVLQLGVSTTAIEGLYASTTLTNFDNTIEGTGELGKGRLTLVNGKAATIDADGVTPLVIDTGASTIANAGLIEAVGGGVCSLESALANSGVLSVDAGGTLTASGPVTGSGSAVIDGGSLRFLSAYSEDVAFIGATGALAMAQSQGYAGTVAGFSKHRGTSFDLGDIGFVSATEATFSGTKKGGVLTVTDGTHTASIHLEGDYRSVSFVSSSDGEGGVTVIARKAKTAVPPHAFVQATAVLGAAPTHGVHADEAWFARAPALAAPRMMTP